MSRQLVENIVPQHWDVQDKNAPGNGYHRVRWLQSLLNVINRPVLNRVSVSTNATAISCNGSVQSSGIGTGTITPQKYAELTIKARVTFNLSGNGTLYIYVYRTTGSIPANGAAPNGGDVAVGGDSFAGPATVGSQNMSGSLSFIDTGLSETQAYRYYLAVKGTNALTANLVNSSQLFVLERS